MRLLRSYFILGLCLVNTLGIAQPNVIRTTRPHGCTYACYLADKYELKKDSFAVYTGDSHRSAGIISLNLNIDSVLTKIPVVIDTLKEKEYEWREVEHLILLEKGRFTEWRKIVCATKRKPKLIRRIQTALQNRNYALGKEINGIVDCDWELEMSEYQKDNHINGTKFFDVESLNALGIKKRFYR